MDEPGQGECPGVKWLSHYLVLGPHDFLDRYEAANEEEAAKVAMISLSVGALSAETSTRPEHLDRADTL